MTRRRGRLALAVAALAAVGALLIAPASLAQAQESTQDATLTLRTIDGTQQESVGVTFLWTGSPEALEDLTIRENGASRPIDDLTLLRKTEKRLGTVFVVDLSGSMGDDGHGRC